MDKELKIFENRIKDYIKKADSSNLPIYTDFLDMHQQNTFLVQDPG